jgi:3'-phosphoadenosine 5'-phosphosulfate sulfotransferase (PAPS reductase)/FAD synthetase
MNKSKIEIAQSDLLPVVAPTAELSTDAIALDEAQGLSGNGIGATYQDAFTVICWWSGGITSAVACWLAIRLYGRENCRIIMIDTGNEDEDTYRFKEDCERWYGKYIEVARNEKYKSIQEVWIKYKSLNVAHGAICSSELKRAVRERIEKNSTYANQVFGFDIDEPKRAKAMRANYPESKTIFPCLLYGYSKNDCIKIVETAGIEIPRMYRLGYSNNNCFGTMCIQGGIGYWQKVKIDQPPKFDAMADMEWFLTELKGKPVTMLKDQSKEAKESGNILVFLKKHPNYPNLKCLADFPKQEVKPLFECNGFCGTNDLNPKRNETEKELNFDSE